MNSSKTTLAGVIGGLAIILGQVYNLIDADPLTTLEFGKIMEALALMGIGLFARDNNVTSEKAGAK